MAYNAKGTMIERAVWAKKLAAVTPSLMEIDDDCVPWVYDLRDGAWYSFDGRYSSFSPEQKKEKQKQIEERIEQAALKRYEDNLYWSKVRQDILKRDNHTCQVCGSRASSTWHVHHIMKKKDGGTDHYDNLIVVCPKCHKKADTKMYDPEWVKTDEI